jgi:hypothetical protein
MSFAALHPVSALYLVLPALLAFLTQAWVQALAARLPAPVVLQLLTALYPVSPLHPALPESLALKLSFPASSVQHLASSVQRLALLCVLRQVLYCVLCRHCILRRHCIAFCIAIASGAACVAHCSALCLTLALLLVLPVSLTLKLSFPASSIQRLMLFQHSGSALSQLRPPCSLFCLLSFYLPLLKKASRPLKLMCCRYIGSKEY